MTTVTLSVAGWLWSTTYPTDDRAEAARLILAWAVLEGIAFPDDSPSITHHERT